MKERFKKSRPLESHSSVQLALRKLEIISRAIGEIETLPEMSRAGILLTSIMEELYNVRQQLESHLSMEHQTFLSSSREREDQLGEQNYIVEFYDCKVKHQEKVIRDLEGQNLKLMSEGQDNSQQLRNLQEQLFTLRRQLGMIVDKSTTKESSQNQLLMCQINTLLEEMEQKNQMIESLNNQVQYMRQHDSELNLQEHAALSLRVLDLNKVLDSAKTQYMKLVWELESDSQLVKQQNFDLMQRLIVGEAQLQDLMSKMTLKVKESSDQDSKMQVLTRQIECFKKEVHQNASLHDDELMYRQREKEVVESRVDKLEQSVLSLQAKLKSKVEEISLLERQNCKLHQFLSTKQNQIVDKERTISIISGRHQQEVKGREVLHQEVRQVKEQCRDLASRLDLSNRMKSELEKERQEKIRLLQEVNERLSDYDTKFTDFRSAQVQKQEDFRKYVQCVKKEYEDVITQLVGDCKALDSVTKQLKRQMSAKNDLMETQNVQLGIERREVLSLRHTLGHNQDNADLHKQAKAQCMMLQQEIEHLKRVLKDLQLNSGQVGQLKATISQLEQINAQLNYREVQCREKMAVDNGRFEDQVKELQSRLNKLNQTAAQRQFEVAQLSTKNRCFIEEISSLKRNGMLEKTRLETRMTELERVLKDKRNFQLKVSNLVL